MKSEAMRFFASVASSLHTTEHGRMANDAPRPYQRNQNGTVMPVHTLLNGRAFKTDLPAARQAFVVPWVSLTEKQQVIFSLQHPSD